MARGRWARLVLAVFALATLIAIIGAALEQASHGAANGSSVSAASGFTTRMTTWASAVFQAAAVLGLLSMVLIQSVKQTVRQQFHATSLWNWLMPPNVGPDLDKLLAALDTDRYNAYHQLLDLIAPSYRGDVLALPVEQLSAQVASAAEMALSNPQYLAAVTLLAGPKRLALVLQHNEYLSTTRARSQSSEMSDERVQIRNELSHEIQRRIDGWQIHTASRWKATLRVAAVMVSTVLATVGVVLSGSIIVQPLTAYSFVLTVGLVGGLLASIARDLVAVIEKYRI